MHTAVQCRWTQPSLEDIVCGWNFKKPTNPLEIFFGLTCDQRPLINPIEFIKAGQLWPNWMLLYGFSTMFLARKIKQSSDSNPPFGQHSPVHYMTCLLLETINRCVGFLSSWMCTFNAHTFNAHSTRNGDREQFKTRALSLIDARRPFDFQWKSTLKFYNAFNKFRSDWQLSILAGDASRYFWSC